MVRKKHTMSLKDGSTFVPCVVQKQAKWNESILDHFFLPIIKNATKFITVFSFSVVSDSLGPHGLQSTSPLCPWEFSRQEYVAMPFSGDLLNPGIEPRSPTLQVDSLTTEPAGKPKNTGVCSLSLFQGIFQTKEDLGSPVLQADSLSAELLGKPKSKNDISLTLAIWT